MPLVLEEEAKETSDNGKQTALTTRMLETVHGEEAFCLTPQNIWSRKNTQERSISPLIPGSQTDNEQVQDPEFLPHAHQQ